MTMLSKPIWIQLFVRALKMQAPAVVDATAASIAAEMYPSALLLSPVEAAAHMYALLALADSGESRKRSFFGSAASVP